MRVPTPRLPTRLVALVLLKIILGVSSQSSEISLTLHQNHSFPFTCRGTAVQYSCQSSSSLIKWTVTPQNGAPFPAIPAVDNNPATIAGPTNITDYVFFRVVTVQPVIITYLTIFSDGSLNKANVSCRTLSNLTLSDSLTFDSGEGPPDPPRNITYNGVATDFSQGTAMINFAPSRSIVDGYIANCSENACKRANIASDEFSVILKTSAQFLKKCFTVGLCSVNFCRTVSREERITVCIENREGYVVAIAFPLTVLILGISWVIIVVLIIYHCKLRKNRHTDVEVIQMEKKDPDPL